MKADYSLYIHQANVSCSGKVTSYIIEGLKQQAKAQPTAEFYSKLK